MQDRFGSVGSYFPYGEVRTGTNPLDTWSFATYWRDSATSLDYADQRYYSNQFRRFMTADRYHSSSGPKQPQSWNRYAYVQGDPINANDTRGMYLCDDCWFDDPNGDDGGGGGGCFADTFDPVPNPVCYVGVPVKPAPPPRLDCDISLEYHSVTGLPGQHSGNHSFLLITGSLGTFIIEGEPTNGAASGLLLGYWGTLQGVITPGVNGYNNMDNPNTAKIYKQGPTQDDRYEPCDGMPWALEDR